MEYDEYAKRMSGNKEFPTWDEVVLMRPEEENEKYRFGWIDVWCWGSKLEKEFSTECEKRNIYSRKEPEYRKMVYEFCTNRGFLPWPT